VLSTIEMETPIRRATTHTLPLENPLDVPVTFTLSCDSDEISVSSLTVPAAYEDFLPSPSYHFSTEGTAEITFLPLLVREQTARLSITSSQLGVYIFDLHLRATPAGNEKPLYFKVGLGSRQAQSFRFINYCKVKTEYQCKIDHPDFFVE